MPSGGVHPISFVVVGTICGGTEETLLSATEQYRLSKGQRMSNGGSASNTPVWVAILMASLALWFGFLSIYGVRKGRFPYGIWCPAHKDNRFMYWFWVGLFAIFSLDGVWGFVRAVS
jgi:hypothetical protein